MYDNIASGFLSPDPQVINTKDATMHHHRHRNGSAKMHPLDEPMAAVG
jgi:hypothetical protein